ncbi:hypothetical protein KM043_016500 [Ampulex compressa]|nr:hypothetical protein KM043_016500 [Ampulex compressa]
MGDNSNDELFMDTLSDCSEDIDLLISDCEVDDNKSIIIPIYQTNRRILSESEDDSADDSESNIIVIDVADWTEDDIRVELKAYGRTALQNMGFKYGCSTKRHLDTFAISKYIQARVRHCKIQFYQSWIPM